MAVQVHHSLQYGLIVFEGANGEKSGDSLCVSCVLGTVTEVESLWSLRGLTPETDFPHSTPASAAGKCRVWQIT